VSSGGSESSFESRGRRAKRFDETEWFQPGNESILSASQINALDSQEVCMVERQSRSGKISDDLGLSLKTVRTRQRREKFKGLGQRREARNNTQQRQKM